MASSKEKRLQWRHTHTHTHTQSTYERLECNWKLYLKRWVHAICWYFKRNYYHSPKANATRPKRSIHTWQPKRIGTIKTLHYFLRHVKIYVDCNIRNGISLAETENTHNPCHKNICACSSGELQRIFFVPFSVALFYLISSILECGANGESERMGKKIRRNWTVAKVQYSVVCIETIQNGIEVRWSLTMHDTNKKKANANSRATIQQKMPEMRCEG